MAFKFPFRQWRKVIPESWKTNKVSPMIPPTYCVERISRLQHREHEPRLSLADTPGRRNGAESPGGQGRQSSRREYQKRGPHRGQQCTDQHLGVRALPETWEGNPKGWWVTALGPILMFLCPQPLNAHWKRVFLGIWSFLSIFSFQDLCLLWGEGTDLAIKLFTCRVRTEYLCYTVSCVLIFPRQNLCSWILWTEYFCLPQIHMLKSIKKKKKN